MASCQINNETGLHDYTHPTHFLGDPLLVSTFDRLSNKVGGGNNSLASNTIHIDIFL